MGDKSLLFLLSFFFSLYIFMHGQHLSVKLIKLSFIYDEITENLLETETIIRGKTAGLGYPIVRIFCV